MKEKIKENILKLLQKVYLDGAKGEALVLPAISDEFAEQIMKLLFKEIHKKECYECFMREMNQKLK